MRALALLLLLMPALVAGSAARPVAAEAGGGGAEDGSGCLALETAGLVAQVVGTPVRTTAIDDQLRQAMAGQAGSAILFGQALHTHEQVHALVAELDAAAPDGIPPLVAVDEEGGRVARLGRAGLAPHLPPARTMAADGTPEATGAAAAELARAMAALGIDLDLAPVLDLSDAPADSIIGDRSFSADPAVTGDHAAAFAAGLHDGGVATTAKHFPDHGLTTTDTHTASARVEVTLEQLRGTHLQPYRRALPHLDAVMLSHLRISSVDPDVPASLSARVVSFLRAELAAGGRPFDGVVMTDDLSMQAVADVADQPSAAVMAVTAGVDLVLIGDVAAAPAVHGALVTAVEDGTVPQARVREAARRVLRLKGLQPARVTCLVGPAHYGRSR